jgi:hypothetical protein
VTAVLQLLSLLTPASVPRLRAVSDRSLTEASLKLLGSLPGR